MMEKPRKPRGNPNPSPETRFQAGQRANPNGKTSEQKRLEMQNAETAMRIRARALHAVEAKLSECSTEQAIAMLVEAAMLKLLKDSEDRGLGSPVQPMDHTTNGKDLPPPVDLSKLSSEALAELVAARDAAKKD